MSTVEEKQLHSIELGSTKGKLRFTTPSSKLALVALLLVGCIVAAFIYFGLIRTSSQAPLIAQPSAATPVSVPSPTYPPSAVHTAKLMEKAAEQYRGALRIVYTTALGGSYVPVIPYELMLDDFMLQMVAGYNLLETVPNVVSIPEEEDPASMGFGICEGIRGGDAIVEQTTAQYNMKLPEVLFEDVDRLRSTTLYKYFIRYAAGTDCDVFLGELRNNRDIRKHGGLKGFGHPIPHPAAKFTKEDFGTYISAVQKLDDDIKTIAGEKATKK